MSVSDLKTQVAVQIDLQKKSFFILLMVFMFFGLTSLVTQYYTNDILKLSGLEITNLPDPSFRMAFSDIWGDFLFVSVIGSFFISASLFSSEVQQGKTVYILLNRPITRRQYFLTRSIISLLGYFVILTVDSVIMYLIGSLIFPSIPFVDVIVASTMISLGVVGFISLQLMINSKYSGSTTTIYSLFMMIGFLAVSPFLQYFDWLKYTNPFSLTDIWSAILFDSDYSGIWLNLLALLAWIVVPILIGMRYYEKRDL